MFPDAPTERGIKHIFELCNSIEVGFKAYIVFVIQMNQINYFTPNIRTHKEFGDALQFASLKGVNILAFDCNVTEDGLEINEEVKVVL